MPVQVAEHAGGILGVELRTQDTRHENSKYKTRDTRHKTQDTRHKSQDTRHKTQRGRIFSSSHCSVQDTEWQTRHRIYEYLSSVNDTTAQPLSIFRHDSC